MAELQDVDLTGGDWDTKERFIGEVVFFGIGNYPVKRTNQETQQSEDIVVKAVKFEIENLSRKAQFNYSRTIEIKPTSVSLKQLRDDLVALKQTKLSAMGKLRFFEFVRKDIKFREADPKRGRDEMWLKNYIQPVRIVTPEEAAQAKVNRERAQTDYVSEIVGEDAPATSSGPVLSFVETQLLEIVNGKTITEITADVGSDPVLVAIPGLVDGLKAGKSPAIEGLVQKGLVILDTATKKYIVKG